MSVSFSSFCSLPFVSGEHFCTNETHLVHYPPSKMNNAEMMTPFCQDQKARVPTEGDMKCVEDFRSLIHKETGHVEQNFANQLCVVRPGKYSTAHTIIF